MSRDDTRTAIEAQRWDLDALRSGASVCVTLAVPFRVLAAVVGGDSGGLNALFFFVFIVLFMIGAGCAAWVQRTGTPMSHALVTAGGTFIVVEAAFVVVRMLRNTEIAWIGIAITLSFVLTAGLVGGFLGNRLRSRGVLPSHQR